MSNLLANGIFDSLWKEYAPAYSKVFPMISFYAETVDLMVDAVKGCHNILDLGCGPGIIAERLAEKGHKVIAIDKDFTMVEFARKRLFVHKNVKVEQQDAHSLKFENCVFDAVVCNNVLYSVEDPIRVLKESYKALKFGGILTLSGPKPNPNFELLFKALLSDLESKALLEDFSSEIKTIIECNNLIEKGGLKNTYTIEQLKKILINDIRFSKILESKDCYLLQSYFIIAKK